MSTDILNNEDYKNCGGKLLCNMIGGSVLYGLNTETSDVDYRGIYKFTNKVYMAGLEDTSSIVIHTDDFDGCYYSVKHYINLLRKTNTQVLEMLFAPDELFLMKTKEFEWIREKPYKLIDTTRLRSSLKGYVMSEIKLATGERSGQLGGKRKQNVVDYGFSPKNFVQILRLCRVGIEFFKGNGYIVRVSDFDKDLHSLLMEIKKYPENFTCQELVGMVESSYQELVEVMENSKLDYTFDDQYAAVLLLDILEIDL